MLRPAKIPLLTLVLNVFVNVSVGLGCPVGDLSGNFEIGLEYPVLLSSFGSRGIAEQD